MPRYRITIQKNVSPDAPVRSTRGTVSSAPETVDITATTLVNALLKLNINLSRDANPQPPRVVAAEELLDVDMNELTDDALEHALKHSPCPIDFDGWDGIEIYMDDGFDGLIADIADALREGGIVPGLNVSILHNSDGTTDYSMVEIRDEATRSYRSVGRSTKSLIDDRSLTGRDGIVSIARTLIEVVAEEHLL